MRRRSRQQLPYLFRVIVNFFTYRKYTKSLERDDLQKLRNNINTMGFNRGIEIFKLNYETAQNFKKINRENQLENRADLAEHEEQIRKEDEWVNERVAQVNTIQQESIIVRQGTFDPNWRPKLEDITKNYEPIRVFYPFVNITVSEYHVPEKDAYIVVIQCENLKEYTMVINRNRAIAFMHAEKIINDLVKKFSLLQNSNPAVHWSKLYNTQKKPKKPSRDQEENIDIDISHVRRTMGLDNNKDDTDDILKDLF